MIRRSIPYNWWIASLFLFYTILQCYCINQLTLNYDEPSFAGYGITILKMQRDKDVMLYESKLPITALNMLPRAVEQAVHPDLKKNWKDASADIIKGRYISLLVTLLLGWLIFVWSEQLYNKRTATFVLLLYFLCPNFLAHGIFVSSDIFACLFITATFYFFWKYTLETGWRNVILFSLACALAQVSKFSMFHLYIILPLMMLLLLFYKRRGNLTVNWKKTTLHILGFLAVNWFVICAAHLFFEVGMPIEKYHFISSTFQSVQNFVSGIWSNLPVPLPSSYIRSMDAVFYFEQIGGGAPGSLNGPTYILGNSDPHGFWYYYLVLLFFKLPVPALLIIAGSIATLFRNLNAARFFNRYIFLVLPVLYYLIYLSGFYSTQLGIRHIMIVFPLLYILCGAFISLIIEGKKLLFLAALFLWQFISVALFFPHFLPYTNEFIMNKKMVYRKFADTNLAYGEGRNYLEKYLQLNPEAIYQPATPMAGKIVVEASEIYNLHIKSMHQFDWLQPLTPADHIHSQYLVFQVPQHFVDSLKTTKK